MKKIFAVLTVLVFSLVLCGGSALAAGDGAKPLKAGDKIFVCGCGAGCDCGTISFKAGKCGCGKKMVKTTVARVENGKIYYMLNGKEMSAPATGKYVCACKGCKCGTISQKPGKCACGGPLKKVE